MTVTGRGHDQPMEPSRSSEPLRGRPLRYLLTVLLFERGALGVADLADAVEHEGFVLAGRPSKLISDALRWEIVHGRVVKTGRGRYVPGQMPKQTQHWIRRRVEQARAGVKNVALDRIGDGDLPKS